MLVRVSLTTATHAHINTHWVWSSMWSVPRAELGWWLPGYCWPGNIFSAEDEEEKRKKKKNSIQLTRTPGQSLTTAIRCFTCYYSWDWSLFCGTDGKRDSLSFKASLSPLTLLSYECGLFVCLWSSASSRTSSPPVCKSQSDNGSPTMVSTSFHSRLVLETDVNFCSRSFSLSLSTSHFSFF